jgi:NADH dehydrogenase FAD-containing subunit
MAIDKTTKKGVTGVERLAPHVEAFTVAARDAASLEGGNLRVLVGWAAGIDLARREVTVELEPAPPAGGASAAAGADGTTPHPAVAPPHQPPGPAHKALRYDTLCLAVGAAPKQLAGARHPCVLTLRDAASLTALARRLRGARRVAVIGNGGIALELA